MEISQTNGSLLVIMLTGMTRKYIAEVVKQDHPFTLKVEESGPFAHLKEGDFIIWEEETVLLQGTEAEQNKLLADAAATGYPLISGLHSLGVTDSTCHDILPSEK